MLDFNFGWTIPNNLCSFIQSLTNWRYLSSKIFNGKIVFGKKIAEFQNTKFKLAEIKAELSVARIFINDCVSKHLKGDFDAAQGAIAKLWTTELQCKIIDECLQLHGGYGYMREYPIAKAYEDARVQRIYGGTNEIMKEIISRTL